MTQDEETIIDGRAYSEHEAAYTIQTQYRDYLKRTKSKLSYEGSIIYSEEQENAAKLIQKQYRYYAARKKRLNIPKIEVSNVDADEQFLAALTIQNHYRNYVKKKEIEEIAARKIQQHYRTYKQQEREFEMSLEMAVNDVHTEFSMLHDMEKSAATTIQRFYKKRLAQKNKAATLIQSKYRSHRALVQKASEQTEAATTIQRRYREHLSAKAETLAIEHKERDTAARKIQTNYRIYRARMDESKAAVCIQQSYRKYAQRKAKMNENQLNGKENEAESSSNELLPELAAITIQKYYKQRWNKRSEAATYIQQHFRRQMLRKVEEERKQAAARKIQLRYKEHLEHRKKTDEAYYNQSQYIFHANENCSPRSVNVEVLSPVRASKIKNKISPRKEVQKTIIDAKKPATKEFEKEWPKSKNMSFAPTKKKMLPISRKQSVQTSLELKREQRRLDKNSKKDKFHLNKLKIGNDKNSVEGPKKVKADTPQVTQETKLISPDPELLMLCDSSEEKIPGDAMDITTFDQDARESLASDELSNPPNHNSSRASDLLARDYNDFYGEPLSPITRIPRKEGSRAVSSTLVDPRRNTVPGGSLDSYAVQNMLRKNERSVRQNNDNSSYLHSYLKQMKMVRRDTVLPVKSAFKKKPLPKNRSEVRKRSVRDGHDLTSSGLEKLAKYGRNTTSEDWKTFTPPTYTPGSKDVSRGSFYPVIPSYGRMKSSATSEDTAELTEIPWPSNIG